MNIVLKSNTSSYLWKLVNEGFEGREFYPEDDKHAKTTMGGKYLGEETRALNKKPSKWIRKIPEAVAGVGDNQMQNNIANDIE